MLRREIDIARFVVGEHKDLYKAYKKIGERRRKLWRQWIGDSLGKFINVFKDIANEKAPNTLSTTQRVDELRRAKATKLDILAEFAKVEDSIYLSVAEEKDAQKHAPMRAVIESFGTEISGHADINLQRRRI